MRAAAKTAMSQEWEILQFSGNSGFYGISRPTLDSWVLKEGIPTMKLGRVKRIQKDAFDEVLKSKRKVEEDV